MCEVKLYQISTKGFSFDVLPMEIKSQAKQSWLSGGP